MRSNRLTLVGVPTAMVGVVVMLVVPLPTQLIDIMITLNLVGAVVILLTSMYVKRALDFSVFPSLLLIATMYRLALNVSVTRQVLLHAKAGNVVAAFGHFVIGGSVVVGLVVFLIIVVIQFVVITNGAGRVAEVAARFTLDGMPGKQMAIDADLNGGLSTKTRRAVVAGRWRPKPTSTGPWTGPRSSSAATPSPPWSIMAINLVGGLAIGLFQNHDSFSQAINTYSLLSVGDGLAAQLPALLISLSTGIIVTRAGTESDLGSDLVLQILNQRRALRIASAGVTLLALIPGLPKLPFVLVGVAVWLRPPACPSDDALRDRSKDQAAAEVPAPPAPDSPEGLARRHEGRPPGARGGLQPGGTGRPQPRRRPPGPGQGPPPQGGHGPWRRAAPGAHQGQYRPAGVDLHDPGPGRRDRPRYRHARPHLGHRGHVGHAPGHHRPRNPSSAWTPSGPRPRPGHKPSAWGRQSSTRHRS